MNIIKHKKGYTLLEVILAITIFAVIALPLFSVFVQSIKIDRKASDVLNANYISQDYLEKLNTVTYSEALSGIPNKVNIGDYYLTANIEPYGNANSMFSGECSYAHFIFYDDGSMFCIMPDGKCNMFSSIPSSLSFSVANKSYTFTGGYITLTGNSEYSYCALIINAMHKPDDANAFVTLGTNCKALVYCKLMHTDDISFTGGSNEIYEGMVSGDTSLVRVTTAVYESESATEAVATSDSYVTINNW